MSAVTLVQRLTLTRLALGAFWSLGRTHGDDHGHHRPPWVMVANDHFQFTSVVFLLLVAQLFSFALALAYRETF